MSDKAMLLVGLLTIIFTGFLFFLALRLRRFTTQRVDAERRSAQAFEQMLLASKQLQARTAEAAPEEVRPGERLQKMYPGVRPPGSSAGVKGP